MAKIEYMFWSPEKQLSRAQEEFKLGRLAEELIMSYVQDVTITMRVHTNVVVLTLPDEFTVEECWAFVNWVEDYFNLDCETNRARHDKGDRFRYRMHLDSKNNIVVENCKENCIIEYEDYEIPEELVAAHTETRTVIKCADNRDMVIA